MLHDAASGRQNLEQALAWGCSLEALGAAMMAIAVDRGSSWEDQRRDLLSRSGEIDAEGRERAKDASSVAEYLDELDETDARQLVASALGAKGVTPFEMKGARQARIVAETIIGARGCRRTSPERSRSSTGGSEMAVRPGPRSR